jgi:hypothetical protein
MLRIAIALSKAQRDNGQGTEEVGTATANLVGTILAHVINPKAGGAWIGGVSARLGDAPDLGTTPPVHAQRRRSIEFDAIRMHQHGRLATVRSAILGLWQWLDPAGAK